MMIPAPLVVAALLALLGAVVRGMDSSRLARRVSVFAATGAVALSGLALGLDGALVASSGWWTHLLPEGLLKVAPLVTALVALIATGLAPVRTHVPRTFARILFLSACAEAFLGVTHPYAHAALWVASSWLAWQEVRMRPRERRWDRVFGWYQLVSAAGFVSGAVLLGTSSGHDAGVVCLLLAIGIRDAVVPLQSWYPRFVEQSPMGIVVAFSGPQLGVYAQLELLDQTWVGNLAPHVAAVGAATAVIAAVLGVVQTRARRAIAYLIISQTGLVAFGLESHSAVGLAGALLNWQVLAVATSGFAMLLAALEARRGQAALLAPNGNMASTPALATAFLVFGFASVGFPLTLGFVAEDLLVQGTVGEFPILGMALTVATAFNGVNVMRSYFYLFTGSRKPSGERDLSPRERYLVTAVLGLLLTLGIAPRWVVDLEIRDDAHAAPVGAQHAAPLRDARR